MANVTSENETPKPAHLSPRSPPHSSWPRRPSRSSLCLCSERRRRGRAEGCARWLVAPDDTREIHRIDREVERDARAKAARPALREIVVDLVTRSEPIGGTHGRDVRR